MGNREMDKALYCANSRTGRFRDSKGFKLLKEEAYKKQKEGSAKVIRIKSVLAKDITCLNLEQDSQG